MLKNLTLIVGAYCFVITLLASNASSSCQVTLEIEKSTQTSLETSPLKNDILITNAQEVSEGYVSTQTQIAAQSESGGGYYVEVRSANETFSSAKGSLSASPTTCFCMRSVENPAYGLDFDLLADKSPQGHPTPVHHQGFGPPQGGTPHGHGSKIINTDGQPRPEKQIYGIYFFIFADQFKSVPHGYYVGRLVVELIET